MLTFDRSVFVKYAEALVVSVLFIAAGYLLNMQDPCFLESKINISLFVVAVLTLFFGWTGLFPFLIVYGLALNIFYSAFHIYQMLQLTVLGLILYLFYYVWDTKIKEQKVKEEYLSEKLDDNSNAFYTLKASYDQLEKAYITKPFSLKDSLQKIIEFANRESENAKEEFLRLLSQLYQVKKSMIIEYGNGKAAKIYSVEKNMAFDEQDALIKQAIEEKLPVYIDFNVNSSQTKYLAVVPVNLTKEKSVFLIIEDMLFTSFNKDALLQISVVFTYFMQSLEKNKFMTLHQCRRPYLSEVFAFELCKLQNIYETYHISSSVISFKSTNYDYMKKLLSIIQKEKRTIDMIQTLTVNKLDYVIIILFPFSNKNSVEGFLSRLKTTAHKDLSLFNYIESEQFIYKIRDIKQNRLENLLS